MNSQPHKPQGAKPPPVYLSKELFQGDRVVHIVHEGRAYRLAITQSGKLILTA